MSKETPLTVSIQDNEVVIRIGINVLANAIACNNNCHRFDENLYEYVRDFAITDSAEFARDVVVELGREKEDGSSPLSNLLDAASQDAVDEGSVSVDYSQTVKFGERSPSEAW